MPVIYVRNLESGIIDLISEVERDDCQAVEVEDVAGYEEKVWRDNFKLQHSAPFETHIKCECPELEAWYKDLGYDVTYTGPDEDGFYTLLIE